MKFIILTSLALIAFAANSVLCRMALGNDTIDAAGFTIIRLLSGALVLLLILQITHNKKSSSAKGNWLGGLMLFLYAITFSYAYITLDTGTGALILFGSVQISMLLISIVRGNRLHISEWVGVFIAFSGLVYLVMPGVTAPSLTGFVLMTTAGIAWGIYTLNGRGSTSPLHDTAYNFLRTLPFVAVVTILTLTRIRFTYEGLLLAVLSGAVASGVGYTIWYSALRGLSATQAAVVQLSVPVIAAIGGVIFMAETITLRLLLAALLILGGILLVVLGRYYFIQHRSST